VGGAVDGDGGRGAADVIDVALVLLLSEEGEGEQEGQGGETHRRWEAP